MKILSILLPAILLLGACEQQEVTEIVQDEPEFDQAIAVIHPTEGNDVSGVVTFTRTNEGILVDATISGLEADARHGFHVHEYGDCSADDGTSAGGHFNPEDNPHAGPEADERHVGDLGNLDSDGDGEATTNFTDNHIAFSGGSNILGRAVVVHAGEDDLQSQPTGDAGARLGCGVIGVANPGE
ncbi:MAG: superoxide dismutase family protein [Balneolaceae bacterium]